MSQDDCFNGSSADAPNPADLLASTESIAADPLIAPHVSRRLRALHVINGEHYSGAERVQDLLAIGLPELQVDVSFVCLKPGKFPEVRASQTPLYRLSMRSRFDQSVVRRLTERAAELEPDVLHAHTPRSAWIASRVARRLQLPFVYHVHSPTRRDSTRSFINWVNQQVEWRAMQRAAKMLTVSHSLGQYLRQLGIPASDISVVPNGVAPRPWVARPAPSGAWTLGTVALFRPRKGIEVLLRALRMLRQQELDVRLLAVGGFETPAYEATIRRLADELQVSDAIEWTGFCQDVETQLQRMDAMVLPSLFGEGLPMVVLEAMAMGVPVIATHVEGVPEAIKHGEHGLLAEPNDPTALATQLQKLISGEFDWTKLRRNAWQRQQAEFSTASMSRRVADVYRALSG